MLFGLLESLRIRLSIFSFSFLSIKIVKFSTVSINCFGLIKAGKKSKDELLINDLALSCVKGTMKNDNMKERIIKNSENIKILFKNLFLEIPFDQ